MSHESLHSRKASTAGSCVKFECDSILSALSTSVNAGSSIASMTRPSWKNVVKSSWMGRWKYTFSPGPSLCQYCLCGSSYKVQKGEERCRNSGVSNNNTGSTYLECRLTPMRHTVNRRHIEIPPDNLGAGDLRLVDAVSFFTSMERVKSEVKKTGCRSVATKLLRERKTGDTPSLSPGQHHRKLNSEGEHSCIY